MLVPHPIITFSCYNRSMKTQEHINNALTRQLKRLKGRRDNLQQRSNQLATLRLFALFAGGALTIFLLFGNNSLLFWLSLITTIVLFSIAVAAHRRVELSITKINIWRKQKHQQRARLHLNWKHIPQSPLEPSTDPLAVDLDLDRLHRLLNVATSYEGALRLRHMLLQSTPDLAHIQTQQGRINELVERPSFRNKLALNARLTLERRSDFDPSGVRDWLQASTPTKSVTAWLMILSALAVVNIAVFLIFGMSNLLGFTFGAYAFLYLSRIGMMGKMRENSQQVSDLLQRLQSVLTHIEQYPYHNAPYLRDLCAPIIDGQPSKRVGQLSRTLSAANLQGNLILWAILNVVVPWDLFFLRRLSQQKVALAPTIAEGIDIFYMLEALSGLANIAALNPQAITPTLYTDGVKPVFAANTLGHPLITANERITNNFAFQQVGDVVIITGSNMSGKSSFLRTLGVNLVLAYAGASVLADSFDARLMRIFSCIRVTDSLQDGISYFYAEVKRLRALLDTLQADHEYPLFFVIDEIFKGTNNRERLQGSASYIKALVGANGVGLIATHDLELTQLADGNEHIRNMHFREHVTDGRMVFDYVLRDGASPTTNALKIMAIEGLPVEEQVTSNEG